MKKDNSKLMIKIILRNIIILSVILLFIGVFLSISDKNYFTKNLGDLILLSLVYTVIYGTIPIMVWIIIHNIVFKIKLKIKLLQMIILSTIIGIVAVMFFIDGGENLFIGKTPPEFWGQLIVIPSALGILTYLEYKYIKPLHNSLV